MLIYAVITAAEGPLGTYSTITHLLDHAHASKPVFVSMMLEDIPHCEQPHLLPLDDTNSTDVPQVVTDQQYVQPLVTTPFKAHLQQHDMVVALSVVRILRRPAGSHSLDHRRPVLSPSPALYSHHWVAAPRQVPAPLLHEHDSPCGR